jgi:vacuolar-type H+-ATPase subunit B/Vma2
MPILDGVIEYVRIVDIVGDLVRAKVRGAALGDRATLGNVDGDTSLAKVVGLERDTASFQVFAGGKGFSTGEGDHHAKSDTGPGLHGNGGGPCGVHEDESEH